MSFVLIEDSVSIGIKGPNAQVWLKEQGISLPNLKNTWLAQQASLVMRLGVSEFMITGSLVLQLQSAIESKPIGVYGIARADVTYLVSGDGANALMTQVCAINTAQMSQEQVWMTQLAGVSVILIRTAEGYRFCCDVSYQAYMSQILNNICQSTAGAKIG
jgi:hypothetical protein